jgi:regulator of sigma E protease
MSIIIFIIILAVLIFVHELGHFLVAKKSGIRVDEFGLGFPPKIFAKKWGETTYTLNAIPFGGFVKIFGEDSHTEEIAENDKPTSFLYKPKWIQASVLVAGVTFNIIFAWLCISLGFMIGMPASTDYSSFGETSKTNLIITDVVQNSPAQKSGLISGDAVVSVSSGEKLLKDENLTPEKVSDLITNTTDKNIEITYRRGDSLPTSVFVEPNDGLIEGKKAIGIAMDSMGVLKLPIHLAFLEGVRTTWFLTKGTVVGLVGFLGNIFTFQSDFSQVSGPVGIAKIVSQAHDLGFVYLLSLIAIISINLAVINLLPFPALDGGRLLFVGIEAVIRRPINPSFVRWANGIGFIFLIVLMLVITGHDIFKLL